jgi:signal peptidase I
MSIIVLHGAIARLHRLARKRTPSHSRLPRGCYQRRRGVLMAAGLLGCGVLRTGLRPGIVVGESMAPTLRAGQWFMLDSQAYRVAPPRRGDIVVFRHRGVTYIKRVMGIGGDEIPMLEVWDADGVWRSPIEPAFRERVRRLCRRYPRWRIVPQHVPAGYLYVIGDMLASSLDSRHLGPIPLGEVRGRVCLLGGVSAPKVPLPPRAALHPRGEQSSKESSGKRGGARSSSADDSSGPKRDAEASRRA